MNSSYSNFFSKFEDSPDDDFVIVPSKISDVSEQLGRLLASENFLEQAEEIARIKEEAMIRFYDTDRPEFIRRKSKI